MIKSDLCSYQESDTNIAPRSVPRLLRFPDIIALSILHYDGTVD